MNNRKAFTLKTRDKNPYTVEGCSVCEFEVNDESNEYVRTV